jgi:hypothetical protein
MNKIQTIGKMIEPTISSVLAVLTGAGVVIGSSLVTANSQNGLLYELVLGGDEFAKQQGSIYEANYLLDTSVFGNAGLNELLYLVFWMVLGIVAYLTVSFIGSSISNTTEGVERLNYVHANRDKILKERLHRIIAHVFVAIGWVIYAVVFTQFIIPFSTMSSLVGVTSLPELGGFGWITLSIVVFSIFAHIHVIFARLLLLRFRIWGGENYISESSHRA